MTAAYDVTDGEAGDDLLELIGKLEALGAVTAKKDTP